VRSTVEGLHNKPQECDVYGPVGVMVGYYGRNVVDCCIFCNWLAVFDMAPTFV
jgi:hypothetical protein